MREAKHWNFTSEVGLFNVQELLKAREYGAQMNDVVYRKIAQQVVKKYGATHKTLQTEQGALRRVRKDAKRLEGNNYDVPQALRTIRWRRRIGTGSKGG